MKALPMILLACAASIAWGGDVVVEVDVDGILNEESDDIISATSSDIVNCRVYVRPEIGWRYSLFFNYWRFSISSSGGKPLQFLSIEWPDLPSGWTVDEVEDGVPNQHTFVGYGDYGSAKIGLPSRWATLRYRVPRGNYVTKLIVDGVLWKNITPPRIFDDTPDKIQNAEIRVKRWSRRAMRH